MFKTYLYIIALALLISVSGCKVIDGNSTSEPLKEVKVTRESAPIMEQPTNEVEKIFTEEKVEEKIMDPKVYEEAVKTAKSNYNATMNAEYRIQLGAFNNLNANPRYPIDNVSSRVERNQLIFDITGFSTANDAYNAAQNLKQKNIKGAFVTKYVNGARDFSYNYLVENPSVSQYKDYSSPSNMLTPSKKGSKSSYDDLQEKLYGSKAITTEAPIQKGVIDVVNPNTTKKEKLIIIEE